MIKMNKNNKKKGKKIINFFEVFSDFLFFIKTPN